MGGVHQENKKDRVHQEEGLFAPKKQKGGSAQSSCVDVVQAQR